MPTNFMQAGTEIQGLVDKMDAICNKAANEIAEACVDRAKSGKTGNSLEADIKNLVKDFPEELQVTITIRALVAVTKSIGGSGNNSGSSRNSKPQGNIFANRGF